MKAIILVITTTFISSVCCAQISFVNAGNFYIHKQGQLGISGDIVNNGALTDSGDVVVLNGTSLQTIGGSSATVFSKLKLDNPAGSLMTQSVSLSGELEISSGTFSAGSYPLTLLSGVTKTARILPIKGDFSGKINMQRRITGAAGWRFLATSVTGAKITDWQDDFVTSGFPGSSYPNFNFVSVYSYDESTSGDMQNGYSPPASASVAIPPGSGYWCYLGPNPTMVDVTGPPVKFTHTFSLSFTSTHGAEHDGWNMVGNPYPCEIDWTSASWTKKNLNNAIYIWNPEFQQFACFVGGVAVNGGSPIIASSQAFWVQSNAPAPVLIADENVKSTERNSFIRMLKPTGIKLRLKNSNYRDEGIVVFNDGSTNGFDQYSDARKMVSDNISVPSISTVDSSGGDMSINFLPEVNGEVYIPVRTRTGTGGSHTLTLEVDSVICSRYCIILTDLYTGFNTKVNTHTIYSFVLSDTTKAPRFLLRVTSEASVHVTSPSCNGLKNGIISTRAAGSGPWQFTWLTTALDTIRTITGTNPADSLTGVGAGSYILRFNEINSGCGVSEIPVQVISPPPVTASFVTSKQTLLTGDTLFVSNLSQGADSVIWRAPGSRLTKTAPGQFSAVYDEAGNYVLEAIAVRGVCRDSSSLNIFVGSGVFLSENDIGETEYADVKIFPNPNDGRFVVLKPSHLPSILVITNANGMEVSRTKFSGDKAEMDLQRLPAGLYFFTIYGDYGFNESGKVIIQK